MTDRGSKTIPATRPRSSRSAIFELEVALLCILPPVWRRMQVRSDIMLTRLHRVLQTAMGWTDSHLHRFESADRQYGVPDPHGELDFGDERRVRLNRLLKETGDRMLYVYGFGDGWEHDILLERAFDPDPGARYPRVVAGERSCPPEDCGGPPGYERFLTILSDPGRGAGRSTPRSSR